MTEQTAQTPQTPQPDKKKKRLQTAGYVVLIVLLLLVAAGGVFAKYVYSKANAGIVTAKEFYFTSDYLTADRATYSLNPGTTEITFTLRNHADNLRWSAVEIAYDVTVTGGEGASISTSSGTLAAGQQSSVAITLSGLQNGQTYTVKAVGRSAYKDGDEYKFDDEHGYSEALTAIITVLSADAKVYKHLDTSNPAYVVLTVWTENISGDVFITFPAGLIPDSTDPVFSNVKNYSNGSYTDASFTDRESFIDNAYSSRAYRFFKEDSATAFIADSFGVTLITSPENSISAEKSNP